VIWAVGLLILFSALAIGVTAPVWSDPIHYFIGPGGDQQLTMSFFGLTQHAIAAHQNPFFSTFLNAPDGVNLAWETASPLLAVLVWPIDALFGPVAGYNVALTAAIALNGWVAALALHKVLGRWLGAAIGGVLYAFSPFVNAHARNHLELAVLVTPPLFLLVLNRMLRTRTGQWRRNGLLLAAVVVAQFYISAEVLLIEFFAAVVCVLVAAVVHRHQVRRLVAPMARTLALAAGVAVVATAWPLYVLLTYPQKPVGAVQGTDIYVADVVNLLVPNSNEAISPFNSFATHFAGNGAEATAYVGIPLAILLVGVLVWQRRNRFVLVAAATGLVVAALSYGGHAHIRGHVIGGVPLPWLPFEKLPLLQDLLPVRFWIVVYLAIAVVVATAVNLLTDSPRRAQLAVGALLVLTAATFFPALPWFAADPTVPPFFTHDAARITSASTVLLAPLPYDLQSDAELWQAWAGTRFKIVGGYIHGPEYEHPRTLPTLGGAMYSIELGHATSPPGPAALAAMRAELARNQIQTVVLGPAVQHDTLDTLLRQVCGAPGASDQGVEVWWSCAA
jgi:hypothetical protein